MISSPLLDVRPFWYRFRVKKKSKKVQKRPPFTAVIHGAGLDINIKVEDTGTVSDLVTKIVEASGLNALRQPSSVADMPGIAVDGPPPHITEEMLEEGINMLKVLTEEQLTRVADEVTKECVYREESKEPKES
jgi:hypothetical protein